MAARKSRTVKRSARRAHGGRKKTSGRKKASGRKGTGATSRKSAATIRRERRRRERETLRLRSFEPTFTVNDIERSVRFYTEVLGFIVVEQMSDGAALQGVLLKAGVCKLGLSQDDWAKGRDRKKGEGVRIWCDTVQDIDALAVRIRAAGGILSDEPRNQPPGEHSISVTDPDGFHLTIYRER
jgi:catechol 2,3-dioxygenase-like lactoylglutathione lyase family enzyme